MKLVIRRLVKTQADWFYQPMARRYERASTIITTNIPFSMWAKNFDNTTASAAIFRSINPSL